MTPFLESVKPFLVSRRRVGVAGKTERESRVLQYGYRKVHTQQHYCDVYVYVRCVCPVWKRGVERGQSGVARGAWRGAWRGGALLGHSFPLSLFSMDIENSCRIRVPHVILTLSRSRALSGHNRSMLC